MNFFLFLKRGILFFSCIIPLFLGCNFYFFLQLLFIILRKSFNIVCLPLSTPMSKNPMLLPCEAQFLPLEFFFLGPSLFSLTKESLLYGFLHSFNLEGKLSLARYLVLGITFYRSLVKFMESFKVVGLWDFTITFKGYTNTSVYSRTK